MDSNAEREALERRLEEILVISNHEDIARFYDEKYVQHYEKDVKIIRGEAAEKFAEFVMKHIGDFGRKCAIIDIGAGTGILGEKLKRHNFTNLFGHDGSEKMLEIAKERQIYKEVFLEILHENTASKTMEKQSFDVLVSLGAFARGVHMNEQHLECLVDLVKPGGLMFIGFLRSSFDAQFKQAIKILQEKITLIEEKIMEKYLKIRDKNTGEIANYDGIFLAFKLK